MPRTYSSQPPGNTLRLGKITGNPLNVPQGLHWGLRLKRNNPVVGGQRANGACTDEAAASGDERRWLGAWLCFYWASPLRVASPYVFCQTSQPQCHTRHILLRRKDH
jgi:hypothetical protein